MSGVRVVPVLLLAAACAGPSPEPAAVTFAEHVAPVIHRHCAACHRPGQSGPFPLLTYDDARRRARQIAEVTASRYMPPWKPVPGYGEFLGQRRMTEEEIALLQRWADLGAPEGEASKAPAPPDFPTGWQLGAPDLEVAMADTFTLRAGEGDVFRNFVIPLPLDRRRFVRAIELRPGNPRVVHHAVVLVDEGGTARQQDARDPEPGFGGMDLGQLQRPGGHFLGWAPGTAPYAVPDSLAWALEAGADLVVQLHMLPSGKPEPVQARVGLVFSDRPPTRTPALLRLGRKDHDIAAGDADYVVEDSYRLPVDADVLSVYPHAHYLARTIEGWAQRPDGSRAWLIRIDDWDFNWQEAYRYAQPLSLPRGSVLHMRIRYDNSADNARNPHDPPRRVTYGTQSSDEMGDLILQVLPRTEADHERLGRDYARKWVAQEIAGYETLLRADPGNADHHHVLGLFHLSAGDGERAARHLQAALRSRPEFPEAHLNLATVLVYARRFDQAETHLRAAVRQRPDYGEAYLNLGLLLGQMGRVEEALPHLDTAARLQPDKADDIGRVARSLKRRRSDGGG